MDPTKEQNEEKVLLEWTAPERPFKKRDKDFWVTAIAILALVSVILFFAKEFFLVVALFSALFMGYVLSSVPPRNIIYTLTNRGIRLEDVFYPYSVLANFWFGKSLNNQTLLVNTHLNFPKQISLVIDPEKESSIKEALLKYLPLVKDQPRFIDKTTRWFADRIPLETNPNQEPPARKSN